MFGLGKNKDKSNKAKAAPKKEEVLEVDIHTMPQKFMPGGAAPAKTGSSSGSGVDSHKMVGMIIIIIAVVVIIGGAAYYLLVIAKKADQVPVNINESTEETAKNVNVSSNVNSGLPARVNVNKNTNKNTNINSNVNSNKNTNLNTNVNSNANKNTNANLNRNPGLNINSPVLPASLDTDKDELTDKEEDLFLTKHVLPDSDSDGFLDGKEVLALYDPNKKDGALLEDAENITKYTDTTFGYQVLYPKAWLIDIDETFNKVLFSAALGEFIEILVESNPERLTAREWYGKQSPGVNVSALETVNVNGLSGIKTPDGLNIYLAAQNKIFLISYNVGTLKELNYKTTFEMMVNSFSLPDDADFEDEPVLPKAKPEVVPTTEPEAMNEQPPETPAEEPF